MVLNGAQPGNSDIFSPNIEKHCFLNTPEDQQWQHFDKSTFKDLSVYRQCHGGFGLVWAWVFLPQICSLSELLGELCCAQPAQGSSAAPKDYVWSLTSYLILASL